MWIALHQCGPWFSHFSDTKTRCLGWKWCLRIWLTLLLQQISGHRSKATVMIQRRLETYCLLSIFDMGSRLEIAATEEGLEHHTLLQLIWLVVRPYSAAVRKSRWFPTVITTHMAADTTTLTKYRGDETCCCMPSSLRKLGLTSHIDNQARVSKLT